jgi:hypothetical protein
MFSRAAVCKCYLDHAEQFADHAMFRSLEAGLADASSYDALLRRVALTHLNCPQLIAFLKSVAPNAVGDLGFAELVEAVAFEYLLDRMGRRISDFLQRRRGLPRPALSWFNRAGGSSRSAQGLNDILAYAECYRDDPSAAEPIVDRVLSENVFVKRYFDWRALPAGR